MAEFEIWVCDNRGYRLTALSDWLSADFAKVANNYSAWNVDLPGTFDNTLLRPDAIFEFWRDGALLTAGFARVFGTKTSASGEKRRTVGGYDGNYLLTSRIVNYYAGSTYADKVGAADDLMKEIVRENLGASSTDTARDLSALNFAVSANVSAAQSVSRAFAYDNVLPTLQSLAINSRQAGTDLYFNAAPVPLSDGRIGWRFMTAINQPGQDRRVGVMDNAVFFSDQNGRIREPAYSEDYTNEATYAVGGGPGVGVDRNIQPVSASEITRTPWARREIFVDARMEQTDAAVLSKARAGLNANRAFRSFRCAIPSTPISRYGVDWSFGDKITIDYDGRQFDAIIKVCQFVISPGGEETITGSVELL